MEVIIEEEICDQNKSISCEDEQIQKLNIQSSDILEEVLNSSPQA